MVNRSTTERTDESRISDEGRKEAKGEERRALPYHSWRHNSSQCSSDIMRLPHLADKRIIGTYLTVVAVGGRQTSKQAY